jgi:hypothetical protein
VLTSCCWDRSSRNDASLIEHRAFGSPKRTFLSNQVPVHWIVHFVSMVKVSEPEASH